MIRNKAEGQGLPVSATQWKLLWNPVTSSCRGPQHLSPLKKPMANTTTTGPLQISLAFAPQIFVFAGTGCLSPSLLPTPPVPGIHAGSQHLILWLCLCKMSRSLWLTPSPPLPCVNLGLALLRCNWYIILCKFKTRNDNLIHIYQKDYHDKVS